MDAAAEWARRGKKLSEKVEQTLERYRSNKARARRAHEILSILVLIGAVLAPILTTLAANSEGTFSVILQGTSIAVGLTIAISEGLRRLIRPETRWKATAIAVQQIVAIRETFRDAVVAAEPGTPAWVDAYKIFRQRFDAILMKETNDFFPEEPDRSPRA